MNSRDLLKKFTAGILKYLLQPEHDAIAVADAETLELEQQEFT